MTNRTARPLSEDAIEPTFRVIDGVSIRFVESVASFDGDRFAESIRYVQSYPTELEALRAVLPQVQTPVQIIAGRRDAVVPPVNAQYLHDRLPRSELHLVAGRPARA